MVTSSNDNSGIPWLKDVPVLGLLAGECGVGGVAGGGGEGVGDPAAAHRKLQVASCQLPVEG